MARSSTVQQSVSISAKEMEQLVTVEIAGQLFGFPVLDVQDILRQQCITKVPNADEVIKGLINLRGRIVTCIDMRKRLGLDPMGADHEPMMVVIERQSELFALEVDTVGDVLNLPMKDFENSPPNLDPAWKQIASGVFRLEKRLLVVVNIPSLLNIITEEKPA